MLATSTQSHILSINTYIISFLYTLAISGYPAEITATIRQSIRSIMIYLLSLIDFLNARTGGSFDTYESVSKKSTDRLSTTNSSILLPGENETTFTLTTFDFLRSVISANLSDPIITIPEIRQQKSNQFSNIDFTIFTKEWIDAFTDNSIAKGLIQNYFGESFMKINSNIFSSLHQTASKVEIGRDIILKKRTTTARIWEDAVYEKVAKIHEAEDIRKHEVTAFDEEMMRIAKSLWRKAWKRMRIYAGQWRHPAFLDQKDERYRVLDWNDMKENSIFYHKMSKFETEARARPFLKLKLIEPSYVVEYSDELREKRDHRQLIAVNTDIFPALGVQNLYIPTERTSPMLVDKEKNKTFSFSQARKDIIKAFMNNEYQPQTTNGNNDKKRMSEHKIAHDTFGSVRTTPKDEIFLTKQAQWIKTLTSRAGFLQLTTTKLVFIFDGITQTANNVAFLAFKLADDKRIFKEWPLENIKEIQRRRYITRKSALEIFFIEGFSVVFNFPNGDHEEVVQRLTSLKKASIPNLIYHNTLDPKKILEKTGITKRWQNYEISNFEYLMALNSLAGRSYKDLTQYHVFPWILSQYSLDTIYLELSSSYRDLSSSMGSLGPDERRLSFESRYENFDQFSSTPKFHFGSHYSSPAIVLQFLVRLYPYAEGAKELQGGKFDLADRLFFSIEESYHASTEEISDVRELLPEFFFLPEFLCNQDRLDFGLTQNSQRVNHVILPRWSENDPYRFVTILRLALESDTVSKNLHSWIDLIFGYKQRGKEAEKALNTFFYLTYEDMIDLDKITDPGLRAATETQVIHFGQTPSQLFVRPHPPRLGKDSIFSYKIIGDRTADVHLYRPSSKKKVPVMSELNSVFSVYGRALIKLRFANEQKLIGVRRDGTFTYFRWSGTGSSPLTTSNVPFSCGIDREKTVQLEKIKNEVSDSLDRSLTGDELSLGASG